MTAYELAEKIDTLADDFMPYEYRETLFDQDITKEENIRLIEQDIIDGKFDYIIEWIQENIIDEEDEDFIEDGVMIISELKNRKGS